MLTALNGPILPLIYLVGHIICFRLLPIPNVLLLYRIFFALLVGKKFLPAIDFFSFPDCHRNYLFVAFMAIMATVCGSLAAAISHETYEYSWRATLNYIIPAFTEEPLYRPFFYICLEPSLSKSPFSLVVLLALLNVVLHLPNEPLTALFCFIYGLIASFAYARTKSVAVCILLHSIWNAVPPLQIQNLDITRYL